MDDSVCLLLTLTDGDILLKCAVKLKKSDIQFEDMIEYPMAYRKLYSSFLPPHVAEFGRIILIERIFEIFVNA